MDDLGAMRRGWERSLAGRRLLIVEADVLIAGLMLDDLEEAGAEVLGPSGNATAALRFLGRSERLDGAILDLDLQDDTVLLLAAELQDRGVAVAFSSILSRDLLSPTHKEAPLLHKAAETWEIGRALFG